MAQLVNAEAFFEELEELIITEHEFIEKIRDNCPDVDPHLYASGYYG
jgi:hypothetical protein